MTGSKYDTGWSDEELEACIEEYADVVRRGGTQRHIGKDVFLNRARKKVVGRTEASIQFRMCNISTVLRDNGKDYVQGWEPMANVGAAMVPRIEALLKKHQIL